jgi:hypothetical protein
MFSAGLIILAVIRSVLSIVLTSRTGHLLDEVTNKHILRLCRFGAGKHSFA